MKTDIVFVRKANMWLFHKHHNQHGAPDKQEWFSTKEEAEKRLKEEEK